MAEITVKHLGLKITIESKFSGLSEQDLYTQAVVSLIKKAKIKEWQSQCEKAEDPYDDPDVLDEFCSAVLIAVAHLYRAEDTYPEYKYKQVKTEKIGNLSIPQNDSLSGALVKIITNLGNIRGMILGGDIRAEEPQDLN
jgi:membrane carboxypeptidase/penicillin-binding protein